MAQQEFACPLTRGEKILVAVDGSAFSDAAVDQAISLGRVCNSQIFVISVVDLYPEQMAVAPALVEKMSEEVRQHLEKAKQKIETLVKKDENIIFDSLVPFPFRKWKCHKKSSFAQAFIKAP